jgi:hypothetical protein
MGNNHSSLCGSWFSRGLLRLVNWPRAVNFLLLASVPPPPLLDLGGVAAALPARPPGAKGRARRVPGPRRRRRRARVGGARAAGVAPGVVRLRPSALNARHGALRSWPSRGKPFGGSLSRVLGLLQSSEKVRSRIECEVEIVPWSSRGKESLCACVRVCLCF